MKEKNFNGLLWLVAIILLVMLGFQVATYANLTGNAIFGGVAAQGQSVTICGKIVSVDNGGQGATTKMVILDQNGDGVGDDVVLVDSKDGQIFQQKYTVGANVCFSKVKLSHQGQGNDVDYYLLTEESEKTVSAGK